MFPTGHAAAIGTAVLWTLSAMAWTSAGKHIGAVSLNFIRLVVTCALAMLYGQIVRGLCLPTDASPETWAWLGLSGFVGFFLADMCFFKALLLIGPRLTILLQSLAPPFAALLSCLFLREALGPKEWLGMVVTLGGVVWVVLEEPDTPDSHPYPRQHVGWGIVLAALAALGQAVGAVLSKRGLGDYDAVAATFIRVLGGMAGFLVLLTLLRHWPAIIAATRHARAMAILSFGAFVGPFLGVALYLVSLRYCHVGVTTTIVSTMPVLILPVAVFVYRERVSLRAVGGALLSMAGVALLAL